MKSIYQRVFLMFAVGLVALHAMAARADDSGLSVYKDFGTKILLKTETAWNDMPYPPYQAGQPEFTVMKVVVGPNVTGPWHTHLVPCFGYIVSGDVTIESKDGKRKTVHKGQVLNESVGNEVRGISGKKGLVVLIFFPGIKDQPLLHEDN